MSHSPRDQHEPKHLSKANQSTEGWSRMAGAGFEFIVAVLLFGAIGYGLDRWFDSSPWLLLIGLGLGFAAGLGILLKMARRMFKE